MAYPPGPGIDPNTSAVLQALLGAGAQRTVDRYYKGKTIHLDGYAFHNCCFQNCILVSDTGAFSIEECALVNCRLQFGPNAMRLLKMFNIYNTGAPEAFRPLVAEDGAVTIR